MNDLDRRVADLQWYHTMDLPGGVTTRGRFDLRHLPPRLPIPPSLVGKRCLDIGTCDGFWAFEFERRGGEVVAIDLADPARRDLTVGAPVDRKSQRRPKDTFALARETLGSNVEWRDLNVYDVSPAALGRFDFVFMGSLLLHLQDPVKALTAVRSVVAGDFLSYDAISPMLTVLAPRTPAARLLGVTRTEWWIPNRAARMRELEAAAFRVVRTGGVTWVKRRGIELRPEAFRRRPFSVALLAFVGVPHTWVLATSDGSGGPSRAP